MSVRHRHCSHPHNPEKRPNQNNYSNPCGFSVHSLQLYVMMKPLVNGLFCDEGNVIALKKVQTVRMQKWAFKKGTIVHLCSVSNKQKHNSALPQNVMKRHT